MAYIREVLTISPATINCSFSLYMQEPGWIKIFSVVRER